VTYRLADGIRIEEGAQGSFLVADRPLRMVRLNKPLLRLVRSMEEHDFAPQSAAETIFLKISARIRSLKAAIIKVTNSKTSRIFWKHSHICRSF
jgi:hypothetical protein